MGSDPLIGEIQMFVGNFAPEGWLECDGSLQAISQYEALFSIVGTFYGGDGRSTFAVPDLRGRVPIGAGSGPGLTPRDLGQATGTEEVSLLPTQMPGHTHTAQLQATVGLGATSEQGTVSSPANGVVLAKGYDIETAQNVDNFVPSGSPSTVNLGGAKLSADIELQNTGAGAGHENMMPWQAIRYIIACSGIYPVRS